ncbi:P68 family surface lipoprotein, partial [Mycoplasma leonicaptivi]|uniref:P68 family surface lipoprotein n=1 Tax=Mycoplasma leonicaptivi TaxID=36742 RepID=UPI000488FFF7
MKNKFKKLFKSSMLLGAMPIIAIAASCGTDGDREVTQKDPDNSFMLKHISGDVKTQLQNELNTAKAIEDLDQRQSALEEVYKKIDVEIKKLSPELQEYYDRVANVSLGVNPNGAASSFTQNQKDHIVIGTTYSETGDQAKALNTAIKYYNENIADASKGIKPVKQINAGSGYPAGLNKVRSSLEAKDRDNFFNIVINYPTVATELAQRDMLLSTNSKDEKFDLDINAFSDKFISSNTTTEDLKNTSTYILPFLKSTNVLSLNGPVLSYVFTTMKEKGVVFADADMEWFNNIIEKGKGDLTSVKEYWGEVDSSAEAILTDKGYKKEGVKVSKETLFGDYAALLKFAETIQTMFTLSKKGVDSEAHAFGIDDIAGVFNQALFAAIGADESNMSQRLDLTSGEFHYNGLKNGEGKLKGQQIFNLFKDGVEKGTTVIHGPGQYASTKQTYHKFAFAIGSTAGYTHNYIQGSRTKYINNKNGNDDFERTSSKFTRLNLLPRKVKNEQPEKPENVVAYVGSRY